MVREWKPKGSGGGKPDKRKAVVPAVPGELPDQPSPDEQSAAAHTVEQATPDATSAADQAPPVPEPATPAPSDPVPAATPAPTEGAAADQPAHAKPVFETVAGWESEEDRPAPSEDARPELPETEKPQRHEKAKAGGAADDKPWRKKRKAPADGSRPWRKKGSGAPAAATGTAAGAVPPAPDESAFAIPLPVGEERTSSAPASTVGATAAATADAAADAATEAIQSPASVASPDVNDAAMSPDKSSSASGDDKPWRSGRGKSARPPRPGRKRKEPKPLKQVTITRTTKRRRRVNRWSPESRLALFVASLIVGGSVIATVATFAYMGNMVHHDRGCNGCHVMRPYVTGHQKSAHAAVRCATCHAEPGISGVLADGARMVGWRIGDLMRRKPGRPSLNDESCRRCHARVLKTTVTARAVRVRHADFSEANCSRQCHSGSAHRAGGYYLAVQMEDCMSCHRAVVTNVASCDLCHPSRLNAARTQGVSSWRATHGAGWQTTHGAGNLETCKTCHAPSQCARCHGVALPHPQVWAKAHGKGLTAQLRKKCATCHKPAWCTNCHGVEMPHPDKFLPSHGGLALDVGEESCHRCHSPENCTACHYHSSHPNVPGLTAHTGSQGGDGR